MKATASLALLLYSNSTHFLSPLTLSLLGRTSKSIKEDFLKTQLGERGYYSQKAITEQIAGLGTFLYVNPHKLEIQRMINF